MGLDWKSSMAFADTVRWAYGHSAFYKRKFDSLAIDPAQVKSPLDLGTFYTTSLDIIENAEDFLCKKPDIVFESSGTTGRNKRIYFSQDEIEAIGHFDAAGLFMGGLVKADRCVNAFDFNLWIPGMITQKVLERAGVFCMAAGKIDPMEVYKRIPVYNFNIIFGEPSWLIKLTEIAEKNGPYPLKAMIASAEPIPQKARAWIEKVWHPCRVRLGYAGVESGGIMAFELQDACGSYHINENDFLFETANATEDGYGEVVLTTLNRFTMPLIRYKNGDISKIIKEACPCGFNFYRLAGIRGRADEMVVTAGGNLYPLMFEEILKEIGGITHDWQIVIKNNGVKEVMEFNLELTDHTSGNDLKAEIFSNIQTQYPDMWKNMSLGIFSVDFKYHPPLTLRAARKLVRLLDKRNLE
jgi:phenylacetate-CoA ligase